MVLHQLHRSTNYLSMFDTILSLYNRQYNNVCYAQNNTFFYKPRSAYGMVGTTSASYLARRRRL